MFHLFWACSPRTALGTTTKKGKEHWQEVEEMEAIKTQISHPYNCWNHPAFHHSACGGRIPLPSPLFYSWPSFLQVAENLPHKCPISSLPLCLALWVLLSLLTSFLAAQTQQSPSSYCFPKVHILYHLRKLEVLTWSILVFPPFLFLSLVCILMPCFCLGELHEDSYCV